MKKQVLVSVDRGETRVALLEATGTVAARKTRLAERPAAGASRPIRAAGYEVAELYLERRGARSIVGNIYKGRVDNVLAGLEAAFVDIGLEKNGFLHVDEIVLPGVEAPRRGRGSEPRGPADHRHAQARAGDRRPGRQGPPEDQGRPALDGSDDRRALHGATRRTARASASPAGWMRRSASGCARRPPSSSSRAPARSSAPPPRAPSAPTSSASCCTCSSSARCCRSASPRRPRRRSSSRRPTSRCASCATSSRPRSSGRSWTIPSSTTGSSRSSPAPRRSSSSTSSCGRRSEPLFEAFGVEEVLASTLSRRVDLPSGGYLMIDYAEALTVIDVNSGSFIGRGKGARLEDTITKTNLEAADEVVRQLRLRDIGGIIVIDFIDMARARNRDAVLKTLRKALDEDRTKTFVVEISPLGLVEMTRQNVTDGVREIMTRPCPTCDGEGVIKSEETIAIEFERRMRDLAKETKAEAILIQMNPRVSAEFTRDDGPGAARDRGGDRQVVPLRGLRGPAAGPLRGAARGRSRAGARARAALPCRARRSTSRSSSRTCTAQATPWPRSTATSSPSRAATPTSARSTWCGSRRSVAPPPAPRWSTSRAPRATARPVPPARARATPTMA